MSELEDNFSHVNINDRQAVSGDFLFKLIKLAEDLSFYSDIEQSIELTLNRAKTKKFKRKHMETWIQYYRDHVSVDHLAEQLGLKSKSSFTNSYAQGGWFSIIKEELLGHVVEEALTLNYYPSYKVIGDKTEPDLIKDNIMIEVKARSRREPPNVNMLNQKEIDHFTDQGELQLWLVSFKPGKYMLEFYSVQKKDTE